MLLKRRERAQKLNALIDQVREYVAAVYVPEPGQSCVSEATADYTTLSFDMESTLSMMERDEKTVYDPGEEAILAAPVCASAAPPNWEELTRQADAGFSETLLRLIEAKGLTDAQCYRRANVDRKLFSKIRSNPAYQPTKPTVFAFSVALELSLEETKDLLDRAGYSLSHSSKFDIILEYFLQHRRYDVMEINEVLYSFDMPLLGSVAL